MNLVNYLPIDAYRSDCDNLCQRHCCLTQILPYFLRISSSSETSYGSLPSYIFFSCSRWDTGSPLRSSNLMSLSL